MEVVKLPDPVLRKQAKNVTTIDESTNKLAKEMLELMREANGVGLAANQIGSLLKIFVYDEGDGPGVIVNPKITSATGEQLGLEGCLSIPGLQGEVRRAMEVVVTGKDLSGKPVKVKAEGMLARIFQHEIDHLNGTLFIDRADPGTLEYVTADEEE
ncbi:MAG: peptide deformylase [Armatimonadota bacterium]